MTFPQCEILPSTNLQEILFVTGGRAPEKNWLSSVANGKKIFCVDKGIEVCQTCGIVPELLIGDFDSAQSSAVEWAREKKNPRRTTSR